MVTEISKKIEFVRNSYATLVRKFRKEGYTEEQAVNMAKLIATHGVLESGWGTKPTGKYNFFGLKATAQQAGSFVKTTEKVNGVPVKITDRFLDFNTFEEGVEQGADRIRDKFHALEGNVTVQSYLDSLSKNHYYTEDNQKYREMFLGILNGKLFNMALDGYVVPKETIAPQFPQPFSFPSHVETPDATRVVKMPTAKPIQGQKHVSVVPRNWSGGIIRTKEDVKNYLKALMNNRFKPMR